MLRQMIRNAWNQHHNFKFLLARNVTNDQPPVAAPQINEKKLTEILEIKFRNGEVKVTDVSGGCGAMFEVYIKSPDFKNLSLVKQHQMVNAVLKEEVKLMHGLRIFTESQ